MHFSAQTRGTREQNIDEPDGIREARIALRIIGLRVQSCVQKLENFINRCENIAMDRSANETNYKCSISSFINDLSLDLAQ